MLPSKSAIFQARVRLGFEPLAALFARVAAPLATAATPGAWLAGRRLVAIDGMCLDVADTAENAEWFGRPGVNKGEQAAFPQARMVALAECGTHVMFDAVVGAVHDGGEHARSRAGRPARAGDAGARRSRVLRIPVVVNGLQRPGRTCCGGRCRNMKPRHLETLADGTWLAELRPSGNAGRNARAADRSG